MNVEYMLTNLATQNSIMAGIVRSAKDLWSIISGKLVLKSKEIIDYELQENTDRILNGILYYKNANQSSLNSLKNLVEEIHFEFVSKISKLLNIDAMQCYMLFCSYIDYEFRGTKKMLNSLLVNERQMQTMLFEIWNYYFSERLYCLLIMKHVLGYCQDSTHPYKEFYESFLEKVNKDHVVAKKIIEQLETVLSYEVPNKESNGPYMNDGLAHEWVSAVLKEQCELLQLLLLYYKDVEPTVEDVERMFCVFKRHAFGMRQPLRQYISEDDRHFIEFIGYLEGLISIQILELEWLYRCQEDQMDNEHYLMKNVEALKKFDNEINGLGSHPSHSPILISWMLVGRCSNVEYIEERSRKLGNLALQLGIFKHLNAALRSPMFSEKEVVSTVAHTVVYDLLSVLLSLFEIHTLGSLQELHLIAEAVLKFPGIAKDFWKKGMEKGVGLLFQQFVSMFPIQFCPLTSLAAALAEAGIESSTQVTRYLQNLPVFAEYYGSSGLEYITPFEDRSVLRLSNSVCPYNDSNLEIPEGTLGILVPETGSELSIVQWQTQVNGWQICFRKLHIILGDVSHSIDTVSENAIEEVIAIGKLVLIMLKSDISSSIQLIHIISLLLTILQRFTPHPSAPLELLATCLNICSTLCKQYRPELWRQLTQINLLPYMTGSSHKIPELASGINTHMGVIGELIASKECVLGKYSLCQAFLNLITNVSEHLSEDKEECFLGCTVYILREILPSFHEWFYSDPPEKIKIGQACLNLLHNLFPVQENLHKTHRKAQELCIYSLLQFEAGQTLLRIVCTGEEIIQQTILKQSSLLGEQVTSLIRLSLSVLNRLLLLRHQVKEINHGPPSNSSPLEKVLFSTPGHSPQPQVVLIVAHYVFQRYNPRLSTLAVQLLKRFAKEFPMSLYACFGSEVEAIRDSFLCRLNSPFEDIRLKVAILEFLTVCVAQQPGLIEMFINVKNKGNDIKQITKVSCLGAVKSLINEKNENEADFPQDLYCAAVEFVHALWAGHQALAMEALKQDSTHWTSFCKVLLSDKFENLSHKIFGYIIRTIALEVFYCTVLERCKENENVEKILLEIDRKNFLIKWSTHISSATSVSNSASLLNNFDEKSGDKNFDLSAENVLNFSTLDETVDALCLLRSWRDFLIVLAKYQPQKISSFPKSTILRQLLKNISAQITQNNHKVLILLTELYLILSQLWKNEFVQNLDESSKEMCILLDDVASNADTVHPLVQLSVVSIAVHTIEATKNLKESEALNLTEWISPVCLLMKKSSVLIDHAMRDINSTEILKLPIAVVYLLNELVQLKGEWLSMIKYHVILPALVSLLTKSLQFQFGIDLALAILILFMTLATTTKAAEMLCATGFMSEITLTLSAVYSHSKKWPDVKTPVVMSKSSTWKDIYYTYLRLISALLHTLRHYVLQDAISFVGVHLDILHSSISQVRQSSRFPELHEALMTSNLVYQLSFHQHRWRLEHPLSLNMLLNDVCDCAHAAVSYLQRLSFLQHSKERKTLPECKTKNLTNLDEEVLSMKRLASDEEFFPAEHFEVQNKLLELLATNLSTIKQYSPGIYEALSEQGAECRWQLLFHLSFSTPSVEQGGPLSFGTILACVNICLRILTKNEKILSPVKVTEPQSAGPQVVEKHLVLYVLETSLALLLSQTTLALTHPNLSPREKQFIRRELAAELNSMTLTVNRYMRRGPLSPASTLLTSPGQTKSQHMEWPFIKLVSNLVDKLFK